MLGNETLWDAAVVVDAILNGSKLPHAIIGGVAVCLHGYQRNTVDIDMLVRLDDSNTVRESLLSEGWNWNTDHKQFESQAGIGLHFMSAGERAGVGAELRFPDPADKDVITYLEGLPVLKLERLIDTKLACGQGNARRMHKDFADVVELIAKHNLQRSFSRKLHKSLQPVFLELVDRARGE